MQGFDCIVVQVHLAVHQIAVVVQFRDFLSGQDRVYLEQLLGFQQVGLNACSHFLHGELRENTIGQVGAIGDGRHVGIDSITHSEATQQIEVEESTQGQGLSFDDGIIVVAKEGLSCVNVIEQVVDIGYAVVGSGPDAGYHPFRQGAAVVVFG